MIRLSSVIGILLIIPSILSDSITLKEGNSFVHYVDIERGSELQKCILHIAEEDISLYPNNIQNANDQIKKRLSSFEKRACGFKLIDISKRDPPEYNLTATISSTTGKTVITRKNISVNINSPYVLQNSTILTKYGAKNVHISCTINGGSTGFCSLYSPNGQLIMQGSSCVYTITYLTKEHTGIWKCELSVDSNVEPVEQYFTIELQKIEKMETWYKEENGYGIIGCKHINKPKPPGKITCSMTTPDQHIFNILENSATDRYDSFGTNFSQNICQIEFKLPLQNYEIGTWKCNLDSRMGFINVKKASTYSKKKQIIAKVGDSPNVLCEVPYAASNCFMVSPEGKIFHRAEAKQYENGQCGLYLTNINMSGFGVYTCHFSRFNSIEDDVITVDVKRYDLIQPKFQHVAVDESDEVVILFTANGPIVYCALEDPKGNTYHIWPHTKTNEMEYYGSGFEHGDCGMRLKHVSKIHEGVWKCLTSTDDSSEGNEQIISETQIEVISHKDDLTTASSSPILIGFIVAVAATIIFVVYVKYIKEKRNKDRLSPANSVGDENSETSFALSHL